MYLQAVDSTARSSKDAVRRRSQTLRIAPRCLSTALADQQRFVQFRRFDTESLQNGIGAFRLIDAVAPAHSVHLQAVDSTARSSKGATPRRSQTLLIAPRCLSAARADRQRFAQFPRFDIGRLQTGPVALPPIDVAAPAHLEPLQVVDSTARSSKDAAPQRSQTLLIAPRYLSTALAVRQQFAQFLRFDIGRLQNGFGAFRLTDVVAHAHFVRLPGFDSTAQSSKGAARRRPQTRRIALQFSAVRCEER